MMVTAWMAGTKFLVSSRRNRLSARLQKSRVPVPWIARRTFISPALYAACTSSQEPKVL